MQPPMPNSSDREVAVFNAALEFTGKERIAYLELACAGDAVLLKRVESLLLMHAEVGAFLESPASEAGSARAEETRPVSLPSHETTGDRIGRYKLLQQIGEGGCGVVYMAEQSEPVRRKVALKVIKLGNDTKNVIARFEAERQALALMDHPNIAKVLDAGATEAGRPFFVMELVKGVRITDYCDQNNVPTVGRLKLFIQVCNALQHAHQKGIIHRDIKPSNILVTMHDGVPVPKVIDFGIAKASSGQPLTDKTLFTAFQQFLGTPAYMSPEQAEMTDLDIDTRTDIYALGVLLYELLTGQTPFDPKELLASGLEAMRRTIREKEPQKPSTRLSTMLAAELTSAALHRNADAAGLVHSLSGDLDWIVMKTLEKDRTRRYETANGLALDVQRYLEDEPVQARPPGNLYRFQKMIRRNKAAFAAVAGIMGALLAGLLASTWLFLMESKAHQRALVAERRAQQGELAALNADRQTTAELWRSYVAQARATRFSGQPGRRFDSLEVLAKAGAIRFTPELRDEAIACLALPDMKFQRRLDVFRGVFDSGLQRHAVVLTNSGQISIRTTGDEHELYRLPPGPGAWEKIEFGRFSHDGKFLPVWYSDGSGLIWDIERGRPLLNLAFVTRGADFRPGDQRLAVANHAGVDFYELPSGKKAGFLPTPFPATNVRFDPSGRKLAISSTRESRLCILDASSGGTLLVWTNSDKLGEADWNPGSTMIATVGRNSGLIHVLDANTGGRIFDLKGHQSTPGSVAFSHDGDLLISSGWDGTHLWHVRTGEHLVAYGIAGALESFSPDDNACGQSRYDGPLELLSLASGREARRWHAGEEDLYHKVIAFSPDGRWLAFGAGGVVKLFDAHTAELAATLPTGPSLGLCFQKNACGLLVSGERGLNL